MDKAAMQSELEQLRATRLRLLSGQQIEEFRVNTGGGPTRNVRYSAANIGALDARIRSLESALGQGRSRAVGVCY